MTSMHVEPVDAFDAEAEAALAEEAEEVLCGVERFQRYSLLGVYSVANLLCAGAWNTLAPLLEVTQSRFQVGPGAVGFVAQSLFLTYVPGSILALYVTERCGLRVTLLVGASSQTLMCLLKWVGVALCPSPHGAYALLLVGQVVGGLGQPLLLNVVSRLTFDWFPPAERDWATLVGYQSSNVGAILFNAVPAWVVRREADLGALFALQLVAWLPTLWLFRTIMRADRPARPPCAAAALQWRLRAEARGGGGGGGSRAHSSLRMLLHDCRTLLRSRNFVLLAALFSLVAGPSWALPAVEGQMLGACGYSAQLAGGAGAIQLLAGVVACAALLPYLRLPDSGETTRGIGSGLGSSGRVAGAKDYLGLQRGLALACASATALLLAATRPLGAGSLLGAWAVFGAAQGPMGPLTLEHAAEISFPVAPDSSSAALFIASNLVSFAQASVLQALLRLPSSSRCTTTATPAAAFLMAQMVLGCACGWAMTREDGGRAGAEAEAEAERAAEMEARTPRAAARESAAGGGPDGASPS